MDNEKAELMKALLKRATGFEVEEVAEEYARDGLQNDMVLTKKKINRHYVQPDVTAMKILLSMFDGSSAGGLDGLSVDELDVIKKQFLLRLTE